ncbi:MAG: SUMF1/EgtB/PvdO family nonheme iron enzyme [Bryobacteraceae bacterium]
MQIGVGQFLGAAACSIAGPAGYFLIPAVAVGAEFAKELMGEGHPLAGAIATVSAHVCSHLAGDKAQSLIEKLGAPGSSQDLEKVFIESMRVALEKARDGLKPEQGEEYREWFGNWEGRFKWARNDAAATSHLFLGKEAFDPTALASASGDEAWKALRATLERWAWEHRIHNMAVLTGVLSKPTRLPDPLNKYLAETLPGYIQEAIPLVLRTKENSDGWIAWQQRFLESTYFEVRGVRSDLAMLIRSLANQNGLPALLQKLHQEILDEFAHQTQEIKKRIDLLEDNLELRKLLAFERGEPQPKADPADYLRTLWGKTQLIDLAHFQPPDATARQFFIERLYTRLTTVIVEERQNRLGEFEKAGRAGDLPLHEAFKCHRLLVLVGDPGSGKTTFLRRIAFELCHVGLGRNRAAADGRSRPIDLLMECDWETLPILVDAKTLANHIWSGGVPTRGALADPANPKWLFDYLGATYGLGGGYFATEAERGCILLVDAFDEVPDEMHRETIGELLRNLAAEERYEKTRIVGTSRPGEHGGLTRIAQFQTARIAPLGNEEIDTFVKNWGDAVHPASKDEAAAFTNTLREEIRRPQVRILAKNPMMLTALAVLHFAEKKKLPEQRSELYKYILEWLAKRRAAKRHDGGGYQDFLFKMRLLAMRMSTGKKEMRAEIKLDEAIEVLEEDFQGPLYSDPERRRHEVRKFLIEEETLSGIIIQSGSNVRFWHLTFREALAAQELARSESKWKSLLFGKKKLYHRHWRETVLLLAGELRSSGGNRDVNDLLTEMLNRAEGPRASLTDRARCAGLMGLLLKDLDAWQYSMTEELAARYKAMLGQVEEIFDKEKAYLIPFEIRLEAANALGQAGDPRLARNNRVPLSGGRFLMGAQKDDTGAPNFDPEADPNESPLKEVEVAPFFMGRYPVTVAEYERFIEERGYGIPDYWRAGGFGESTEPEGWEGQLEQPNRPVVGVSWHEASAYCAWTKGRLPTEAEWEYAARADRRCVRYPWGNEDPDERRANYGYNGSPDAPTPVGLYPSGATPTGIHDLAGNVWEWVEDSYDGDDEKKVLRGGGWGVNPWDLRVSDRDGNHRIGRNDVIGFRCVWELLSL